MASKSVDTMTLISDASGSYFIRSTLPDSVILFCKLKGAATAIFVFSVFGRLHLDTMTLLR